MKDDENGFGKVKPDEMLSDEEKHKNDLVIFEDLQKRLQNNLLVTPRDVSDRVLEILSWRT